MKRRSSLPPVFPQTTARGQGDEAADILAKRGSTSSTSSTISENSELATEEQKLMRVNRQIKSTLTELLNCEGVRGDRLYRAWVQTRLMDAERELRGGRRHSLGQARGLEEELGRWRVHEGGRESVL